MLVASDATRPEMSTLTNSPIMNTKKSKSSRGLSSGKILIFFLVGSFNQPKLPSNASWDPNRIVVTNRSIIGSISTVMLIDENNTMYLTHALNEQILIWDRIGYFPTRTMNITSLPLSLFITRNDEMFIGNRVSNAQIHRWSINNRTLLSSTQVYSNCYSLFVAHNNDIYCSLGTSHQVIRYSSTSVNLVAGTGCSGFSSLALNSPRGIFVTATLNLYVADMSNNRIQYFLAGQRNGITVIGNGSNETISLRSPTSIIFDADNYIFIVDAGNSRIIGSDAMGFSMYYRMFQWFCHNIQSIHDTLSFQLR